MHALTRAVTLLVAISLGLLPMLPAEHVHDAPDDHGHHRLVTHRHAEPHHIGEHHAGTTLDDVDPVTVVETVFTTPTKLVVAAPVLNQLMFVFAAPAPRSVVLRETPKELIHGPPPSPSLLRAPPSFLTL